MNVQTEKLITRLLVSFERNSLLDMDVARALGFEIAATTSGYHIMKPGAVASWELPPYSSNPTCKAKAIAALRAAEQVKKP